MNTDYKNFIIVGLIAVVAILALVLIPRNRDEDDKNALVTDYHTCVEAGFPILETFPPQCKTSDNRTFTDDINENAEVVISTPERGALVTSPLTVSGKAKGTWFFEANIPVTLKDTNGKVLSQVGAQAQGEWMTSEYVNFTTVLNFSAPETEFGVLLIEKDNPSGLPENDASFAIPIRFR
jgi:hypothetical protein